MERIAIVEAASGQWRGGGRHINDCGWNRARGQESAAGCLGALHWVGRGSPGIGGGLGGGCMASQPNGVELRRSSWEVCVWGGVGMPGELGVSCPTGSSKHGLA
jgi:hypothetical protein